VVQSEAVRVVMRDDELSLVVVATPKVELGFRVSGVGFIANDLEEVRGAAGRDQLQVGDDVRWQ
jgi:hypothetical protein